MVSEQSRAASGHSPDRICDRPVVRFAPSPNGHLHIGHACSAILNHNFAQESGGRFLLRIEDLDQDRFRAEFLAQIEDDLAWLGLKWEKPVRRQSEHFAAYRAALETLAERVPLYCATMSRQKIREHVADFERTHATKWPRDPDGAPHYPATDRPRESLHASNISDTREVAVRLAMAACVERLAEPLTWTETGSGSRGETGLLVADPLAWGDVVLARKGIDTSYMLSVVVDDAIQGITHVIRGHDLFWATSVQRLLQHFLDLPAPIYHHHQLLLDDKGQKLSKSRGSFSIKALRDRGASREDVYAMIGVRPL